MKKSAIIIFITAVIFPFAAVNILNAADKPKLTSRFLASEKWILPWSPEDDYDDNCPGKAEFTQKGDFILLRKCSHAEMWIDASGSYKINGDKITLKIEKSEGEIIMTGMSLTGTLTGEGSLEFEDPLGFIDNRKSLEPVKAGELIKFNDFDAVSMGEVSGHTTSVMKVRYRPGTNFEEMTWTGSCDTDSEVIFKSIKKDTGLVIIARTKEKDKVGKWNNYWYYVKFYKDSACGGSETGWVFGEFVKIQ